MKKSKLFLVGILASALVFALVLAGCGDEETGDPAGVGGGSPSVTITGKKEVNATLTAVLSGLSADEIRWEVTNAAGDTKSRDLSDFDDNNTYLVTNNELNQYIRVKVSSYSTDTDVYSSAFGPIGAVGSDSGGTGGGGAPTWTAVADTTFDTSNIESIAYGGGKFVVVGGNSKAAYSIDGVDWTSVSTTLGETITGIAYGGAAGEEKFVAVSTSGRATYSTDGVSWTAVEDTTFAIGDRYFGIAYGGDKFVMVGYNTELGTSGKAMYSTDGVSWTAVDDTTFGPAQIHNIAYGGGKFVAGGQIGMMAYSTDGVSWTAVENTTFGTSYEAINSIAYGGDKFVAAGGSFGSAAYSTDGVSWTAVEDTQFGGNRINGIIYGGGKFVAVGNMGKAAYSTDGIRWTAVGNTTFGTSRDTSEINGIAYGGGKFVAVGNSGKMAYSNNQ